MRSGSKDFWEGSRLETKGAMLNLTHVNLNPEETIPPSPRESTGRKETWRAETEQAGTSQGKLPSSLAVNWTESEVLRTRTHLLSSKVQWHVLDFVGLPSFHTCLFFSLKWFVKYITWYDCVIIALQDFSDEKPHKLEKTLSDLVLKFLVHKVSSPDLEIKNRICFQQNYEVSKVRFPSLFSLFLFFHGIASLTILTPRLPASSQARWHRCLRSATGFLLDVDLEGVECKSHSINIRIFCFKEKVVEETEGQRGPHHHDTQSVFILSTAGEVLRNLAEGRLIWNWKL